MPRFGYFLSSEKHGPAELARIAKLAEQAAQLVTEDMISAPCGPDARTHIGADRAYVDAGFDEVYVSQAGPDQEAFFDLYAGEVLPRLRGE